MSSAKRLISKFQKMRGNMRPLREKTFVEHVHQLERTFETQPLIEKTLEGNTEILERLQQLERALDSKPLIKKLTERVEKLEKSISQKLSSLGREVKNRERTNYQQLTTYMELRRVFDNPAAMPALRGYAISPDLAFYLLDLLERYKPQSILEFGSGFSSVVFSRYAHSNGARVVSLDHESSFAKKSEAMVKAWGYGESFTLVTTDVIEQEAEGKKTLFYDRSALDQLVSFDFVFLDGPPQKLGMTVRGGLLPLFRPLLAPGCIIVLDDYYRDGEREVVAEWLSAGYVDLVEENTILEKHAAVLRLRSEQG